MRPNEGTTALFDGRHLDQGFESIRRAISDELRRETKHQILNVNEAQYVEHMFSKHHLEVPEIIESGIQVESSEVEIPAEHHSPSWSVQPGRTYPRQMLTFEVPFTGDYNLFTFSPSHRSFSAPRARLETHRLLFEFVVLDRTARQIREEFQTDLKQIQETLKAMRADVEQFEKALLGHIAAEFQARKLKLLEQDQIVSSLGVPVKRAENVPQTLTL